MLRVLTQIAVIAASVQQAYGVCNGDPNNPECHTNAPTASPTTATPTTSQPTFVYSVNFDDTIETKVYPHDGTSMDYYGFATAIHDTTAVVGAYGCKDQGDNSGGVYVYSTNATRYPFFQNGSTPWYLYQKLTLEPVIVEHCDDRGKCDYHQEGNNQDAKFGYAVGVWNETLIVGAHHQQDAHQAGGSAYVFHKNGRYGSFTMQQMLYPEDGHDYHYFGIAVAMWQDSVLVGASGDDHGGTATGSVYVFELNKEYDLWFQTGKLTAENPQEFDNFGAALALHKNFAVVGAFGDQELGNMAGAAYVFMYYGMWVQNYKLLANDGGAGAYFGHSVGLYETSAIVGAYQADGHWDKSGAAYIFRREGDGTWIQQNKLVAHDGMTGDYFGWSVGIYKDTAVIGAYGEQGKEQEQQPPHRRRLQGGGPGGEGPGEGGQAEDGHNCGPNSPPDCEQYEGSYSYRGSSAGAAYVFASQGTIWLQEYKLLPNSSQPYDAFGKSVAIHENVIFVGADMADGANENSGAAYIYAPETMSPENNGNIPTDLFSSITGKTETDILLLLLLVMIPVGAAVVVFKQNMMDKEDDSMADHMQVPQDSQHGSLAPWSMHGAFENNRDSSFPRPPPGPPTDI